MGMLQQLMVVEIKGNRTHLAKKMGFFTWNRQRICFGLFGGIFIIFVLYMFLYHNNKCDVTDLSYVQYRIARSSANFNNKAHMIWCQSGADFTYNHYLSVLSVLKVLKPDILAIYVTNRPPIGRNLYNNWWKLVAEEYANIEINDVGGQNCSSHHLNDPTTAEIYNDHILQEGGYFVDFDAIVGENLIEFTNGEPKSFGCAMDPTNDQAGYGFSMRNHPVETK